MPLGLLDLSIVTNSLIGLLDAECRNNSRLWTIKGGSVARFDIDVTGLPPDTIREMNNCQLSLYLFHVSPDKFQRNSPVTGPYTASPPAPTATTRVPRIPFQPLSLDLHYLLSVYSQNNFTQEQQAMSIALKCLHENPIIKIPIAGRMDEFCLTMEIESADEIGRLWLSVTSALRLSAVYKVSVVFLEPPTPKPLAKPVETFNLLVGSTPLPFADTGQVISTYIKVNYTAPADSTPNQRNYELSPAVVAPGQSFLLSGDRLNQSTSNRLYLLSPDGTEQDVTAWISLASTDPLSRFTLTLPTTGAPTPGVYQLRVGNTGTMRSNATPFSIAAGVDPTGGAIIAPGGVTYTINGSGFSGNLEVILGAIALTPTATLASGKFTVNGTGTSIRFQLPPNLPNGLYGVRVRVNGVESPPAKWVEKT